MITFLLHRVHIQRNMPIISMLRLKGLHDIHKFPFIVRQRTVLPETDTEMPHEYI